MFRTTLFALTAVLFTSGIAHAQKSTKGVTPEQAMKRLTEGNQRYTSGKPLGPHRNTKRRLEVAKGQAPFAIIVSCSDSRVPPELLFDQGLGDLFVTRLAGNIADNPTIGSIEFAHAKLGANLILVLGHERCGAVEAAMKGGEFPGQIGSIVEKISPAVERTKAHSHPSLDGAIQENVREVMSHLKNSSSLLAEAIKAGKIKIVGGVYDLDTGKVTMLR